MAIWSLTDMNDCIVLVVSAGFLMASFLLIAIYWKIKRYHITGLFPVVALLFSLKQAFTMLWPSCNMWYMMIFFSIASFFCYWRLLNVRKKRWLILSIGCATLSMFSVANGALIWIAYLVIIIVRKLFEREPFFQRDNLFIMLAGLGCYFVYFINWERGIASTSRVTSGWQFLETLFPMVVSVFFETNHLWLAFGMGMLLIGTLIALGCYLCFRCLTKRAPEVTVYVFPLLICVFFFGSIVCIAYSRGLIKPFSPGGEISLNTWYSIPSICFVSGAYLFVYEFFISAGSIFNNTKAKKLIKTFPCILFIVFVACSLTKIKSNIIPRAAVYQKCSYMTAHYDDSEKSKSIKNPYIYSQNVSTDIVWLREHKLSLFSEKTDNEKKLKWLVQSNSVRDPTINCRLTTKTKTFWIDHINGEGWAANINTTADSNVFFSGWTLDDVDRTTPCKVYFKFREQYYSLLQINHVKTIFDNKEQFMDCFEGWLPLDNCPDGSYPLELIILCDDGKSYYQAGITTVIVG